MIAETSLEAFEAVKPKITAQESLVFCQLRILGNATCQELEAATGLEHPSCSARITRLLALGRLKDTGERRKTRSGSRARVYAIVEDAR